MLQLLQPEFREHVWQYQDRGHKVQDADFVSEDEYYEDVGCTAWQVAPDVKQVQIRSRGVDAEVAEGRERDRSRDGDEPEFENGLRVEPKLPNCQILPLRVTKERG